VFSDAAWAAEMAARRRWGVRCGVRMLPESSPEFGEREASRCIFDPFR
jgi:hypothetical protein